MELLDYVNELTRTHTHREHYTTKTGPTTYGRDHITTVPPLLHQLRYASPSGAGEERANLGYESRPAASLDALDTLTRIEHQATAWFHQLALSTAAEPRSLVEVMQKLAALHAGIHDPATRRDLEHDVRRWWAQARVITGWDSPAWRPDNTCPMCGEHGTLRVKLAEKVGLCVECRETWAEDTIGLLADHIRLESAKARPPLELVACWCPWPAPRFEFVAGKWGALCPSCGSRHCHRARPNGRMSA
jgi:hypothetical protein